EFSERFGGRIEQTEVVLGFEVNDGRGVGGIVIEIEPRLDAFAGQGLEERPGRFLSSDQAAQGDVLTHQGAVPDASKTFARLAADRPSARGGRDTKSVQD